MTTDYSPSMKNYSPDARGFAAYLIDTYPGMFRYAVDTDRFYVFNDRHWERCGTKPVAVRTIISDTAKMLKLEQFPKPKKTAEAAEKYEWLVSDRFIKLGGGAAGTSSTVSKMADDRRIACLSTDFDLMDKPLVNFRNGTYDLDTGDLRDHSADDMLTACLAFDYTTASHAPLWGDQLSWQFDGDREYAMSFERALSAGLAPTAVHQMFTLLYGGAGTGKGVLTETARILMGPYATAGTTSLICQTQFEHDSAKNKLDGKRYVLLSELGSRKIDTEKFKDITGSTHTDARALGKESRDIAVSWSMFANANGLPEFAGRLDPGAQRRLWLFPGTENTIIQPEDSYQLELLAEGSVILSRLARAARDVRGHGIRMHEKSKAALDSYRQQSDTVFEFFDTYLEHIPHKWTLADCARSKEVWDLYKKQYGTAMGRGTFNAEMRKLTFSDIDDAKSVWKGIRIKMFPSPSDITSY